MAKKIENSLLGNEDKHYKRLNIARSPIAQFEDGTRTGGKTGTFEWWYFDSRLDDGSKMVVIFYTKDMLSPNKPAKPYATFELTTKDGVYIRDEVHPDVSECSYSSEKCDVRIANCSFEGDLSDYTIKFRGAKVSADITLHGNVPAWRPETGHIFFGDDEQHYFAWMPAVPEGTVQAQVTVDGVETAYSGSGYHDHNWGNISMMKLMNHWYWGRAKVGQYNVISSYITGEEQYGFKEYPIFMLAKDGEIISGDSLRYLKFTKSDVHMNDKAGKPTHYKLVYDYDDGKIHYRITYVRHREINEDKMINSVKGIKKYLAKLVGFDGAYVRFEGDATIERIENGEVVESVKEAAIWELLYFGKSQPE